MRPRAPASLPRASVAKPKEELVAHRVSKALSPSDGTGLLWHGFESHVITLRGRGPCQIASPPGLRAEQSQQLNGFFEVRFAEEAGVGQREKELRSFLRVGFCHLHSRYAAIVEGPLLAHRRLADRLGECPRSRAMRKIYARTDFFSYLL